MVQAGFPEKAEDLVNALYADPMAPFKPDVESYNEILEGYVWVTRLVFCCCCSLLRLCVLLLVCVATMCVLFAVIPPHVYILIQPPNAPHVSYSIHHHTTYPPHHTTTPHHHITPPHHTTYTPHPPGW